MPQTHGGRDGEMFSSITLLLTLPRLQSKHTRAQTDLLINPRGSPSRSVWFSGLAVPPRRDSDSSEPNGQRSVTVPSRGVSITGGSATIFGTLLQMEVVNDDLLD